MPFYYGSSLFPPFGDSDSNIFGPGGPGSKPPTPPPPSSGGGGSILDPPSLPGGGGSSNIWWEGGPGGGGPRQMPGGLPGGGPSSGNIWGGGGPQSGGISGGGSSVIPGRPGPIPDLGPQWGGGSSEVPIGRVPKNYVPGGTDFLPYDPKRPPDSGSKPPTGKTPIRPRIPPPSGNLPPSGRLPGTGLTRGGAFLRGFGAVLTGATAWASGSALLTTAICRDMMNTMRSLANDAQRLANANLGLAGAAKERLEHLTGNGPPMPQACMNSLIGLLQEIEFLEQQLQHAKGLADDARQWVDNTPCHSELVGMSGLPNQSALDAKNYMKELQQQINNLGDALDDTISRMNAILEACGLKPPRRQQRKFRFKLAFNDGNL